MLVHSVADATNWLHQSVSFLDMSEEEIDFDGLDEDFQLDSYDEDELDEGLGIALEKKGKKKEKKKGESESEDAEHSATNDGSGAKTGVRFRLLCNVTYC